MSDKKDSTTVTSEKIAIGEVSGGEIHYHRGNDTPSADDIKKLEVAYLDRLMQDCGALDWLRSIRYQDDNAPQIVLDNVYTGLLTTTHEGDDHLQSTTREDRKPLSAVDVLNKYSYLVLTGAPGSGKSAFVNFLALCLAGQKHGDKQRNLTTLTYPLPDDEGKPQEEKQCWDHGALIPVRVILRDFASSESFPEKGGIGEANHLIDFIKSDQQQKECADYFPHLKSIMKDGKALIMLDGLDEVPEAGTRRERMVSCIHNFKKSYAKCRILVTCRPYAYEKREWQIPDFTRTSLADFNEGQVRRFIDGWYASCENIEEDAKIDRAKDLKLAIFSRGREALKKLVERPLLLTMTAYLHAYGGKELPEQRAALYEALLELLIEKWERARYSGKSEEDRQMLQPSLADYLNVGPSKLRKVLEQLAFTAHDKQKDLKGTADITAGELTLRLRSLAEEQGMTELSVLGSLEEYLGDRVGILCQRGVDNDQNTIYTFPHRSFQEYLAACHFGQAGRDTYQRFKKEGSFRRWYDLAAHLVTTKPDKWREVVMLLAGIKAITDQEGVGDLIDTLYPDDNEKLNSKQQWGLRLAGEILAENLERDNLPEWLEEVATRITCALPRILKSGLSAEERVAAGRHLAKVGDPRQEVVDVDSMQFCYVPEGKFYLGGKEESDESFWTDSPKGAGDYTIDKAYWLSRYPVTVAQFCQFVEDDTDFEPENSSCLKGLENTPVVYVSWDEAVKFCQWLEQRWHHRGWLPEGYRVTLPSEPEWEMAAKGGYQVPLKANLSAISTLTEQAYAAQGELKDNSLSSRYYPWGDEEDAERMNYAMKIGSVSTVGAYPKGQSAYGCEELSGNVLEWTRSKRVDYPYPEDKKGRRERENLEDSVGRVLRGGAFRSDQWSARCSFRYGSRALYRFDLIGFRVAVSPLL